MSLYAYCENGYLGDFATNQNSYDFVEWTQTLSQEEFP